MTHGSSPLASLPSAVLMGWIPSPSTRRPRSEHADTSPRPLEGARPRSTSGRRAPLGNAHHHQPFTGRAEVVHRRDVERSLGSTTLMDPVVAADGIDEYLDVFVRTRGLATQWFNSGLWSSGQLNPVVQLRFVELRGIEPLTSSLRTTRSTN